MSEAKPFRRDEILGGMPARRVSSVLYAIERRTATLAAQARQAMATYQAHRSAEEQETAFLSALSSGRTARSRPSVQDLERYAPDWADLVPDDAATRAALARMVGQTYRLPRARTLRLQTALGLDEPGVATAFARAHDGDIDSIWTERLSLADRLAWRRSAISIRIESLPPFWMAFALTLTEAVGLGILVLPIALAGLGPLPGLVLLIVLGLANLITVGALVESITRSGPMRYGTAYFGRLVADLLGRSASVVMGMGLIALSLTILLAFYLAFGSTLSGTTGIPAGAFVAVIFGVNLLFLYRESIETTVASAILIGTVNIGLIMLLVVLSLPYVSADNVMHAEIPFVGGNDLDIGLLALVFGVVLAAYFGHTSAANASKVVLRIDPGGSGLLMGNLAALLVVIVLYCVTVFVFLGALGSASLVGFGGTVLTPLGELIGPAVDVIGSIYITLAIGLGSIYYALGSYNQVKEVLPRSVRANRPAGRLLAMLPTILIFLLVEALIALDLASITEPLSLVGTLVIPVVGGVLPMLLILAARRRGELVPERVVGLLGRTSVIVVVSTFFIGAVFVHGLFIWEEPIARLLAAAVGTALVVLVARLVATRTFRPRTVIELRRYGQGGRRQLHTLVSQGRSLIAPERGPRSDHVSVDLPQFAAPELLVWAHQVAVAGGSQPLSGVVHIERTEGEAVDVALDHGRVTLRLSEVTSYRRVDVTIAGTGSGEKEAS